MERINGGFAVSNAPTNSNFLNGQQQQLTIQLNRPVINIRVQAQLLFKMAEPTWEKGIHELGEIPQAFGEIPLPRPMNGEHVRFKVKVTIRSRVRELRKHGSERGRERRW